MNISITKYFLVLLLIASSSDGFHINPVFPLKSRAPTTATRISRTKKCQTSFGSRRSCLRMGLLEDWVARTDESSLKKSNEIYLKELQVRVERINALEPSIENLSDEELAAKTVEFRQKLASGDGTSLDDILEEAFACVREAAWRVLEQRHYDVQMLGGMVLNDGRLAEMVTGEGKTLVATLPSYLNALNNQTSFVVTVNDYLARRDAEKMGQIHKFLGLSVGLIQGGMKEEERKKNYQCDIVYVTNSELGFDYLRDHLSYTTEGTVLPEGGLDGFCVVDEADSVLIDEARTPLIISRQVPAPEYKYKLAKQIADNLKPNIHYTVDLKNKNININQKGYRDTEKALGIESLFIASSKNDSAWAPFVSNAVKAKELFQKDIEYTVLTDPETGSKQGIGIIDSFTGRVLDGRRWSDGLHQSIEAKEGITVSQQSQVIASVTYQSLFRQFSRLSGMTGTALSDAAEFDVIYGLVVTPVPTALPVARRDYPDVVYKSRRAANDALVKEVESAVADGRPCLVGTTSVAMSEVIVKELNSHGIEAELLNASPKNALRESDIIAQAGRAGKVTVATNMAGRGTDILLGGCPNTMARIKARSFLTSKGILMSPDDQLIDSPDESYYPCSVTEDANYLLSEASSSILKYYGKKLSFLELDALLTVATDTTESEEDPEHVIKLRDAIENVKESYKEILSKEKDAVKRVGGLYVIGTNRHESSRIDNQLRGRAGRQGDPGTSRFLLSFEDDMFVIFGADKLKNILNAFRVSDDMPIEAEQVTKALDQVQRTVEEKYREVRTELLKFSEVLNNQRMVIYSRRRSILFGSHDQTLDRLKRYNKETVADIVNGMLNTDEKAGRILDPSKVLEKFKQFFPSAAIYVTMEDLAGLEVDGVKNLLTATVDETLKLKQKEIDANSLNKLSKTANFVMLLTMDNAWADHLQNMEYIKEGVILRKYQGLDPVAEYQNDALELFEGLQDSMRRDAVYSFWQNIASTRQPQRA